MVIKKKIHSLLVLLITIPSIPVSATERDTVPMPVLVPSLQAQMLRQEKINKKNIIAERRALLIKAKQNTTANTKTNTATVKSTRIPVSTTSFVLLGAQESDRQKYLLSKYATTDFQDWQLWIDIATAGKVDPGFMMCVGLAESTLGQYLKTPYNIGNIGNTDSGGTYSFSSPAEGLTWMAATFNNRYLKKYTKVSELSRWGNPDGMIYASSPYNWHNNTIRCLRALKGDSTFDDHEFRIR